jgi:hypothetical protein
VKLRPKVLKEWQDAVVKTYGEAARFYLVSLRSPLFEIAFVLVCLDHVAKKAT